MSTLTLNRQGLADRLDACFAMHGAPPVTLLQFEVDGHAPAAGEGREAVGTERGANDATVQLAVATALRARVRGGDLVACLDAGAVVVGCVGAAPSVTALLLERLRAAVGSSSPNPRVSAGLALSCATRERCEHVLDEIGRGLAAGFAGPAPGAERRLG